jgi:hypothetical protein
LLFHDFRLDIINNGTPLIPDEALKITTFQNRYGDKNIKVGVYDIPANSYNTQELTIHILPINDAPIMNNLSHWEDLLDSVSMGNNLIEIEEFHDAEIQVDAYDIEEDSLTYSAEFEDPLSDFASAFNINSSTGVISFYAAHSNLGKYTIDIIVTDNGENPDNASSKKQLTIEILPSTIDRTPKSNLAAPINGSILRIRNPILKWDVIDVDTSLELITYNIYLSMNLVDVMSHSENALIAEDVNAMQYEIENELNDKTTFYWTVIPFDGIFNGICQNGWFEFEINTTVIAPVAFLKSPANKIVLNNTDIELTWGVIYDLDNEVEFDIYIGSSENSEDLILQDTVKTLNYKPSRIFNDHTYYWGILPKAIDVEGIVEGDMSELWSFSIQKDYRPPKVYLIEPNHEAIFKTNNITFKWEIDYEMPDFVDYRFFLSSTDSFGNEPYATLSNEKYLQVNSLEVQKYYWKVIPFIQNFSGIESEVRWFRIDPSLEQPIVIPIHPKNNSTLNVTSVDLEWSLDYSGEDYEVEFEIYLDTSDVTISEMTPLSNNYTLFNMNVELKDNTEYHWYVIPMLQTQHGIIVGEFQNRISTFTINTSYTPPPKRGFELELETNYIKLGVGEETKVKVNLKNTGNVDLTLDITYNAEPTDLLYINMLDRRIEIPQGSNLTLYLKISTPPSIEPNTIIITVQATADGFDLSNSEELTVEIISKDKVKDKGDNGNSIMNIAMAVIIIIIIIIILFMVVKKFMRKIKLKEVKIEPTESRIWIPSKTPYTSEPTEEAEYKPPVAAATATATPSVATTPIPTAVQDILKTNHIKPVTPVTPTKPSTAIPTVTQTATPKAATTSPTATPVAQATVNTSTIVPKAPVATPALNQNK